MPKPRLTNEKRVPETYGHDTSPGEIGVDMSIGRKIFVWYQSPFKAFNGYGMSIPLYEYLKNHDVEYVYIDDSDSMIKLDGYDEKVSATDSIFKEEQDDDQYIYRPS